LRNRFEVTAEHEKALAQAVLIPVQNEPPAGTFRDDGPKICVTKVALFHHIPRPVSEPIIGRKPEIVNID
jgi:hypothetical protein